MRNATRESGRGFIDFTWESYRCGHRVSSDHFCEQKYSSSDRFDPVSSSTLISTVQLFGATIRKPTYNCTRYFAQREGKEKLLSEISKVKSLGSVDVSSAEKKRIEWFRGNWR